MIPIIEMLTTQPAARPKTKLRKFTGITIHDTANLSPTADAKAHAVLQVNRAGVDTSWHYSVDQGAIYRSIPEDEVAWHAGDGTNGPGNNETVSIETCVNQGNDYSRTLNNTIDLCADILFRRGIKLADPYLFQHNHWTGKDCPHRIRVEGLWDSLKLSVQGALDALQPTQNAPQEEIAMKIPSTIYVVIDSDPQGIVRKDTPGMGPTHKITGKTYKDAKFVADALQVVDDFNWAHGPDGWYPTGPADLSQIWIQAQQSGNTAEMETLKLDKAALTTERDNNIAEVNRLREIILDGPRKMDP